MSKPRLLFSIIFISFISIPNIYGQVQNVWLGGSKGHETDWNYFKNWSKNKVPNEFNDVIIPDTRSTTFVYPVIEKGNIIINSLEMFPGTALVVKRNANLIILYDFNLIFEKGALDPKIETTFPVGSVSVYYKSDEEIKIFANAEDLLNKN